MNFSYDLKYLKLPREFNLEVRYNISRAREGKERKKKRFRMVKRTYPRLSARLENQSSTKRSAAFKSTSSREREGDLPARRGERRGLVGGPLAKLAAHRNTHKLRCNYKLGDHDRRSGRPTDRISKIPESGRERPR